MGEHCPDVGELVLYYVTATITVLARVTDVVYWDLVTLEVDGELHVNRRRVVVLDIDPAATIGRWTRIIELRR